MEFSVFLRCRVTSHRYGDLDRKSFAGQYPGGRHRGDAEGQKVLEKFHYGSATKEQPFKRWRPEHGLTTEKYEKDVEYWEKLLKQIGHK